MAVEVVDVEQLNQATIEQNEISDGADIQIDTEEHIFTPLKPSEVNVILSN